MAPSCGLQKAWEFAPVVPGVAWSSRHLLGSAFVESCAAEEPERDAQPEGQKNEDGGRVRELEDCVDVQRIAIDPHQWQYEERGKEPRCEGRSDYSEPDPAD